MRSAEKKNIRSMLFSFALLVAVVSFVFYIFVLTQQQTVKVQELNEQIDQLKHDACEVVAYRKEREAIEDGRIPGRVRQDAYAECIQEIERLRQELRDQR